MMRLPDFTRSTSWRACAALLALLCGLQLLALLRAPAAYSPAVITVTLKPGEEFVLGSRELAAPQADSEHLRLRRARDGAWWIRNASAGKQLLLRRAGHDRNTGSSLLRSGDRLQIGGARLTVDASDTRALSFSGASYRWRYDGATLYRDGEAQRACPGAAIGARAAALWNRAAPAALTLARPLAFGGNLHCGNRLGVAWLAGGSAQLSRVQGSLLLSGAGGETRMPLLLTRSGATVDLAQQEEALGGVDSLVAGRTRLGLSIDGDTMQLTPRSHVALFTEPLVQLAPQVTWRWQQRAMFALPAGAAWSVGAGLCLLLFAWYALSWQRGAWPFVRGVGRRVQGAAAASLLLSLAGVTALLLQRAGSPPGVAWSMLLCWAALWSLLLVPGRLHLAVGAGALLQATGLLAQLDLGLGGMESSWLRHYQKSVALLAMGLGVAAWLRLRKSGAGWQISQTRLEWLLALLAAGALGALLLQVLFGDETGVFDLQPVEFAKVALTALMAHCLAVGLGWHAAMPEHASPALRWCRLAAPALLFAALLGLALVQVDDFSPLILLLVCSMAMAMAWSAATRSYRIGAGLLGVAVLAGGAIALLRSAGVAEVAQWGFYGERFLVWLDPARHPHTGQQLLMAARAITEGAWWGADQALGVAALGQPAGGALHIPAVQDDFAPSFFLNRHGLLGALALWGLQALFLVGVLQTAARAFADSVRARDFRHAWLARFRCFTLCGGAAFVLGHLMLSWGTNLAIFPIMGQPMSFLSAGGSHLLFFICPLLAFCAISAQSIEENQSCRSMSNAKS